MNPQMYMETQLETSTELALNDTDMLAGWGFDAHEIASLLWLQQWYQTNGSDRANMVRHLEFLKMLVRNGELEL